MIYISSSCVKHKKIKDSIQELVDNGFKNIELSGGTEYYDGFDEDLLELKNKYDLNYLCHNYFPPPKEHFVVNLASLNDEIFNKSLEHLINSLTLSNKLSSSKFGFHAGFFIDISINHIGKKLSKEDIFDKKKSIKRFCEGFNILQKEFTHIELYLENNVFSSLNLETYEEINPFMLTNYKEFEELKEFINFKLLLDIAHLKVSCQTLGLVFESELSNMIKQTNYLHLSDNDGLQDLNLSIEKESELINILKKNDLTNKDITLEIYSGLNDIKNSIEVLQKVYND
ncbi:TIM barrel protein [Arcobacter arenosus]|uniref:Xylose isomerase n=1 Tax=Arcobacter arenosus TaxID=2576037 RepID=A0A5R8Y236_9BACT|nr:TIM barrel protein [Arcobacter arenosus]TLP38525.1 xylose isomerase [Arcobacter arenosus]